MLFDKIIGHRGLVDYLKNTVDSGKIPHTQLFVGDHGTGILSIVIAYAQYILCQKNELACHLKVEKIQHPDLHFSFPTAVNEKVKQRPTSKSFFKEWILFLEAYPFGSLFDWIQHTGIENKQVQIGVEDAEIIKDSLKLKSYEGGYKVTIIWMMEKMNDSAANKLLKILEEPSENTVFLLIAEQKEKLLMTILSRCQILEVPELAQMDIETSLMEREKIDVSAAREIAKKSRGSYRKALEILNAKDDSEFENLFISWVRMVFKVKKNKAMIQDLIIWINSLISMNREKQKQFISYALSFFRQALLLNYGLKELVLFDLSTTFDLEKFSYFIHSQNIGSINTVLNEAHYHIESNGNAKLILLDTSIKLIKLLYQNERDILD